MRTHGVGPDADGCEEEDDGGLGGDTIDYLGGQLKKP